MRSAETSGVDAIGFGAFRNAQPEGAKAKGLVRRVADLFAVISPVSYAVGGTALLAATLYTLVDTARTFDDTRARLLSVGHALLADAGDLAPLKTGERILTRLAKFDPAIAASFSGPRGEPLVANVAARIPENTAFVRAEVASAEIGTLALGQDQGSAMAGVWQRAGIAYAAAFALGVAALRRRPKPETGVPDGAVVDLIGNIPFGIAWWSQKGELVTCNDQYRTRCGMEGAGCDDRHYHASVRRLAQGGYVRLVSEGPSSRTLELHREDGSCLLIDERPLASGGFVTLVSDVTERKRTDMLLTAIQEEQRQLARRYHEEKLKAEAASRAKTSFLAHLSHDIRTPLNHIIGFADLIRHQTYGPLGDARYLDYVDTIKGSGERLLTSFATILELAELESGSKVLRQDPVRIDDLLISVARRFSPQAGRAGLTLALGAPCGATVQGDRLGLERMLCNLVENAVRFTPDHGKVTLAAYAGHDGVVVEVSDTGIGIGPERLGQLSQPFAFGDATFTRDHEGAGLGIAIARAIAEISGGNLAIDSTPALGTTVAISLPLMVQAPAQPVAIRAA